MQRAIAHEDFIAKYFVEEHAAAICAALGCSDLHNALDYFEDTRTEQQVNDMLLKLTTVTDVRYTWSDDDEVYYAHN